MSSPEGMVFFDTRLACPLLDVSIRITPPMKTSLSFPWHSLLSRVLSVALCLFPSVLLAHPGHYHPDETDEFDFFTSAVGHSHGALDWVLIALVIASLVVAVLGVKPGFKISALAVGLGSLSLLPIF
jgi:hypothetical protein